VRRASPRPATNERGGDDHDQSEQQEGEHARS
jgi:hypothetical protein